MQRDQFMSSRRERWERLDALTQRASRGGLGKMQGAELLEIGRLYRNATSDLALARRDFPDDRVTLYLNGLVGRAHPMVYQDRPLSPLQAGRFLRYGFPAAYRAAAPYTLAAFSVFLFAAVVAAVLVAARPSMADVLMPGQAEQLRSVMVHHHLWVKSATENHSVAANFIMLNNIQVAFFAVAGGMLLGVGTIYVMAQNGIMLGAVGAMVAQYGLSRPFWSFVLPHGMIELSVIFMSGGAGLMLGDALLRPGLQRRQDALVAAGRRAVAVIVGAVPLLIIAGSIEGFFSPSDAPDPLKWLVSLVTGALLYGYLLFSRPQLRVAPYRFDERADDQPGKSELLAQSSSRPQQS